MKNVKIDKIKPYEKNPRRNQPVDLVAKSIKEFGFQNPIIVNKDNVILAGHTRYKAAQKLKLKEVPVIVADMSEDKQKAFRIIDNKLGEKADWDNYMLEIEFDDIEMALDQFEIDIQDGLVEEVEVIEKDKMQKIEKYKELIFLYEDPIKYANHFKKIQEIKYDFGFDTDDQIIEFLLEKAYGDSSKSNVVRRTSK
jgi:site-specific DNA-methyltransferase (adenine-specific)|tara:strand:+ start:1366 stop:1953 length:588 start_codon:yes stop_codon:yes gene_type:complete